MNLSEFNYFQIVNIYVILNLSVLQIILENILEYKYSESISVCDISKIQCAGSAFIK